MSKVAALLERFRRGPEVLEGAVAGLASGEADYLPGPGKWTIRQIMAHVADSELVGADRFRRIIAENHPTLVGYDQEAWARNLDYQRREISQSAGMFRRIRMETYELLQGLPEATFERTSNHTERGSISLLEILEIHADHAENHARQLRAGRDSYRQASS